MAEPETRHGRDPRLGTLAFPAFGNMPVDQITRADGLAVLTPIWGTLPETVRRVRQRIRSVMRWAVAHGFVEYNVAGEAIEGALPPMPRVKDNHRRSLTGRFQRLSRSSKNPGRPLRRGYAWSSPC